MIPGQAPDLSKAELVDYSVEKGEPTFRIRTSDGTLLELRVVILGLYRAGNDPLTGVPGYVSQAQIMTRVVECPAELRKKPAAPPGFG